jgi:hypothetical protein
MPNMDWQLGPTEADETTERSRTSCAYKAIGRSSREGMEMASVSDHGNHHHLNLVI